MTDHDAGLLQTQRTIAHHEAGHAVMAWAGCRRLAIDLPNSGLLSVSIPTVARLEEIVATGGTEHGFCGITEIDNRGILEARDCDPYVIGMMAEQAVAGLIAEYVFLKARGLVSEPIFQYLDKTADDLHLSHEQRTIWLSEQRPLADMDRMRLFAEQGLSERSVIREARDRIKQPRTWRTIETLADNLVEKVQMSGEEASRHIAACYG